MQYGCKYSNFVRITLTLHEIIFLNNYIASIILIAAFVYLFFNFKYIRYFLKQSVFSPRYVSKQKRV